MQKVQEMEAAVNPIRRIPSPPEPVDVSSPQWVARAWQWVFDRLEHLDECMDGVKAESTDTRASLEAWMTTGRESDEDIATKWREHVDWHKRGEAAAAGRSGAFRQVRDLGETAFRYGTNGAVLAAFLFILKQIGVI